MHPGVGMSDEHYQALMKVLQPHLTQDSILISDSNWLKCKIAQDLPDVRISMVTAIHSGRRDVLPEDLYGVAMDIDLAKHSRFITILTQEGYGFVKNVANVFGIKYRTITF
jgi:hypothetical protein